MDLFSIVYDPTVSSPFGLLIEHPDGQKSLYGLSSSGREWAGYGNPQTPSWMISTPLAPYTKSAQEAMQPAIDGDIYLSLDEIREHVNPELNYVGRTVRNRKSDKPKRSFSISSTFGIDKSRVADYLAVKFNISLMQNSAVNEVKSANLGFSSKLNVIKSASNEESKSWLADRVGSALGRSAMRRMGEKVNSDIRDSYSDNSRINRRVKSLIGNIEIDISDYPINERITISGIERIKR